MLNAVVICGSPCSHFITYQHAQIWPTLVAQRQQPGTSCARIRLESRNRRSNNRWLAYRNSIFPHDGELLADSGYHSSKRERTISSEKYTWRAVSILFLALGINKQLDLQTALTELGRVLAYNQGWYGERQTVQVWFIVGVAITCITTAIILLIWARKSPAPTWLALLGTAAVLAFVLIRAASFHHIDRLIGQRILGLTWNWVLEMGGISLVLVASEWRRLNLNTRVTRSN